VWRQSATKRWKQPAGSFHIDMPSTTTSKFLKDLGNVTVSCEIGNFYAHKFMLSNKLISNTQLSERVK